MNRTNPVVGLTVPVGSAVSPGGAQGIEGAVGEALPIGTMLPFSGELLPDSFLWCDGASYPRVSYPELAEILGTVFGGDANNFNVPDCRNHVLAGAGDLWDLGELRGEFEHTLTVAELASHTHTQNAHSHTYNWVGVTGTGAVAGTGLGVNQPNTSSVAATNQNTGDNAAHNNIQPTLGAAFIIKAERLGRIGISDAPEDDRLYARKNAEWAETGIEYDGSRVVVAENMIVHRSGDAAIAGKFTAYGSLSTASFIDFPASRRFQLRENWFELTTQGGSGIIEGIRFPTPYDDGTNIYCHCLTAAVGYDNIYLRIIHVRGNWAGFFMGIGSGQSYSFRQTGAVVRGSDGASVQWIASDARHKRDIGPCEIDALAFLRKIPIAAYTNVKDGVRRACGWVAQQVEKVAPHWVFESDVTDISETEKKVFKRVEPNDQGLPYVIRALQQLADRLDRIEQRLSGLEARRTNK